MDINELIAIVKKKIKSQIIIEDINIVSKMPKLIFIKALFN